MSRRTTTGRSLERMIGRAIALTNAYLSSSSHDYLAYMAGAQSTLMLLILLTTLLASLLLTLDLQIFITV